MRDSKAEQYIFNAKTQYLTYNTLTVAFTVGETITGATSNKTAVVLADDGVSILTVGSVSGAFTLNENLVGDTTGRAKYSSVTSLTGNKIETDSFRFVQLTLSSAESADFVVKFQGSMSDTAPDFSAARSVSNRWDYIQVKDLQSGTAVDGDTGVTFSAADDVLRYETVFSGYKWVCATLTTYTLGLITLSIKLYSND
jgi:hypothetical protein